MPEPLLDVNQEVWHVWQEVQTQWRSGPGGIIGLDYAEVRQAFDEFGVEYNRRNKRKVMLMERLFLDHVHTTNK